MTGDVIDAIARRLVSPATHRFVVLPALADLQYEVRTRPVRHAMQAYAGAWTAVFAGVLHDLGVAIQRPSFLDDARMAALLIGMQVVYYGCLLSLTVGGQVSRVPAATLVQLAVIAVVVSAAPVAALVLPRRDTLDATTSHKPDEIA